MRYVITEATNFLRVFQLPSVFPEGFCFGGARPCFFHLTDWFNAFDQTQLWDKKSIEYDEHDPEYSKHIEELRQWIMQKKYFAPTSTYLIITDYGHAFLVNPKTRAERLTEEYDNIRNSLIFCEPVTNNPPEIGKVVNILTAPLGHIKER